jgi:hypothetical protein
MVTSLGLAGGPSLETAEPPSLMLATYTDEKGHRQVNAYIWPSFIRQITWFLVVVTIVRAAVRVLF